MWETFLVIVGVFFGFCLIAFSLGILVLWCYAKLEVLLNEKDR